ncbi:free methionine-(R)-sulfoxide reductase, putative [Babesia ovis]|uniref:Free methionine-(R)-sulfoxide reductase, putative n=1 Tax=Babesia ovis TaxID=5869 RepID=A0A9W5WVZ1_BABOV|nr:free methionine-(R)-sulfoxide reductase, putative [Babesia ovis]
MITYKSPARERIQRILKSLTYDNRISCDLIKDYANIVPLSINGHLSNSKDSTSEVILRHKIESTLRDSADAIQRLAILLEEVDKTFICTGTNLTLLDIINLWKRDIALRIVLFNQLPTCDEQDLQRLLRIWLDSPYVVKLPFMSD